MKLVTRDVSFELLEEDIIIMKLNDNCSNLRIKGAIEAIEKLNEIASVTNGPKAILSYLVPFYTQKEVLKYYRDTALHDSIIATALIASGIVSKFMVSIMIKMRERFFSGANSNVEVKVFSNEEEAKKWLKYKLELVME